MHGRGWGWRQDWQVARQSPRAGCSHVGRRLGRDEKPGSVGGWGGEGDLSCGGGWPVRGNLHGINSQQARVRTRQTERERRGAKTHTRGLKMAPGGKKRLCERERRRGGEPQREGGFNKTSEDMIH